MYQIPTNQSPLRTKRITMYYKVQVEECQDVEGYSYPKSTTVYEQILPVLNVNELAVYLNEPKD